MSSLVKVPNKRAVDNNGDYSSLKSLWISDNERPPIYSREQFLQDWNRHVVEPRSR